MHNENMDDETDREFAAIAVAEIAREFVETTDPDRLDLTAAGNLVLEFLSQEQEALSSMPPKLRQHFARELVAHTQAAIIMGREFEALRLAED